MLLKPAATELRLLLWSLIEEKEGRLTRADLPAPPGQGLTSVAFDASTPRGFYRTVGFRLCGPRAVRIDMLERLGDLIRERVFWRPRIPEEARPAGSAEGGGFTIIPDMMSLVGCSGEEFQAILKSLNFRMDKRRKPAPVAAAPAPAAEPKAETEQAPAPVETVATIEAVETPAAAETAAPAEPEFIEVWWPKDTGPFRARPERKVQARERQPKPAAADGAADAPREPRKAPREPRKAPRGRDQHKKRDEKPRREERPPRPEKPIDKDSPFAVLGALKAQLAKKG